MRIHYVIGGHGSAEQIVDLAEWAAHEGHKTVALRLTSDEWAEITQQPRATLTGTVSRLAKRWRITEGEAARHVVDVLAALNRDELAGMVARDRDPDEQWRRGYAQGYADGKRDAGGASEA